MLLDNGNTFKMTDQTNSQAATQSGLEQLTKKYSGNYTAFDKTASQSTTHRIGGTVSSNGKGIDTVALYRDMESIKLDLAGLAEQYGKLNVTFSNTLGKDAMYSLSDMARIAGYTLLRRKNAVRQIKIEAAGKKGESLVMLVGKMGEVLNDQYQAAQKGLERVKRIQTDNVSHYMKLNRSLVERLGSSYVGTADVTEAENELRKIEGELNEVDGVLAGYENKITAAKQAQNATEVSRLVTEANKVLDIKEGILTGKLAAEGTISDIRRNILSSAEGIQSARGAMKATKVNYAATTLLIDSYHELVFKYEHAMSDFVPVFQGQANIASAGMEAMGMRKVLTDAASISQRLMEANQKLVTQLSSDVFDLVKNPLYDLEKCADLESRLQTHTQELNRIKLQWAENLQRLSESTEVAHLAQHQ